MAIIEEMKDSNKQYVLVKQFAATSRVTQGTILRRPAKLEDSKG